jgi:hypothetical protein
MLIKTLGAARPLCSTGVTLLLRYYEPRRRRLVFDRFPGFAGYTIYLAPPISRWDEDGFSSCLTCPCHRAVPTTPSECHDASVSLRHFHAAFALTQRARPPNYFVSRPLWVHSRYGPMTRSPSQWMALSVGFIRFVSSTDATQATGSLTLTPAGLPPTEHASFRWTHWVIKIPSGEQTQAPPGP